MPSGTARAKQIADLERRGEAAWRDVEEQIDLRSPGGYNRAVLILTDLAELADTTGMRERFTIRPSDIRTRHQKKGRLIERLNEAGLP